MNIAREVFLITLFFLPTPLTAVDSSEVVYACPCGFARLFQELGSRVVSGCYRCIIASCRSRDSHFLSPSRATLRHSLGKVWRSLRYPHTRDL